MKIGVFGLGYVGSVTAACLSQKGHIVVGVDINRAKVDLINEGKCPVVEDGLDEIIAESVREKRLLATTNAERAIEDSEISMVCVGTPSESNGRLDLRFVRRVCEDIGSALRYKTDFHVVVCRSTQLPGTGRHTIIPILEKFSEKKAGKDFGLCYNPEFLREGCAVHDFYNPAKTVVGEYDSASGEVVAEIYQNISTELIRMELESAELIKYADNAWHALKVAFANEIGTLSKALGIDGHHIMEVFCKDTKLNLSARYLRPGFAFGGSCLPKELRALAYQAKTLDLDLPVILSILPSNQRHIERGLRIIMDKASKKVGVLGLSFKAGTDDLRESPMVEVVERLLGKGYDLRVYDRKVNLATIVGANRDYLLNHIPHISRLLVGSIEEILGHADTVVVGNEDPEFRSIPQRLKNGQALIDFVRIGGDLGGAGTYDGICW